MNRWFAILSIVCVLWPASVWAQKVPLSKDTTFQIARLKYPGGNYNPRPHAIRPLASFIILRTSLDVDPKVVDVVPESKDIFSYPFLLWTGDRSFPKLSKRQIGNLRKYLRFGGFLLAEDSQASPGFGFDSSFRREMKRIFPDRPLAPVSKEHTVFRSFYILTDVSGRVVKVPHLDGISLNDRTVLMYSSNDLQGAWSKDSFGNSIYEVIPGGYGQRHRAFRLGVNILMYALCDDYKKDALHVNYILKRRRSP